MDAQEFDRLTRLAGAGQSRRRLLKAFVGAAAAIATASVGVAETDAAARKRGIGQSCSKNADCSSNFCGERDELGRRVCQYEFQGTCATGADLCAGSGEFGCNGSGSCFCATTKEGATACVVDSDGSFCAQCVVSSDCSPGWVCVLDSGIGCSCDTGIGFCEPICQSI
jgi:hypothetical protein